MNDYMLEEMAEAIANELHVDNNKILSVLQRYWHDKIAPVWQVDDVLEAALNSGTPIMKDDAIDVLKDLFEGHDAELGITWATLDVALQEYHLDWKRLSEDRYPDVQGVFQVWRKGNLIAHQIGLFPDRTQGNLPKALTLAKSLADITPGVPILIGCEARYIGEAEPWLSVVRDDDVLLVEEKEETCAP